MRLISLVDGEKFLSLRTSRLLTNKGICLCLCLKVLEYALTMGRLVHPVHRRLQKVMWLNQVTYIVSVYKLIQKIKIITNLLNLRQNQEWKQVDAPLN